MVVILKQAKIEELNSYIDRFRTIEVIPSTLEPSFIKVERKTFKLNNGETIDREVIKKKDQNGNYTAGDAVIVLPITVDNQIVMVIESRVYTKETVGIGFPAGYKEENESVIESGIRELQEETGYISKRVKDLGGFYQDEGCSEAYNHILLATGCLKVSKQKLDKGEFIEYFLCSIDEAYEMLDNGNIKGASSQLALLKARPYILKK